MPAPVLANSFGVSPIDVELEVPTDGSATQDFTIYGLEGAVTIGLEGVPLDYDPESANVTDGETITVTFYGDGTNNTYDGKITFLAGAENQVTYGIKVRLTVHVSCTTEVVEPTPPPSDAGGNGDGGPPTYSMGGNLFGETETFYTDYKGTVQRTVRATSQDGKLTVAITKGTIALGKDNKRLKSLEVVVDETPPDPPEDANIIGLPYSFSPAGATFDPPITFTWSYDPDALPEGVAEGDLVLAFYDEEAGKWVELECVVDTENNTVTASVEHFTTFALMVTVPKPTPAPMPTPAPTPAPAPAPAPVPPPVVVAPVPGPAVPEPLPAPVPPVVIPPAVPPVKPEAPTPWGLIIGLVAATIIAGLGIWLIRRWRTRQ